MEMEVRTVTINERVKYFRKDILHMNQTEFALSIGMKQTSVSSFEKEGATVSDQSIKAISSVDKSYLIYNCLSRLEMLLFQLISDLSVKSCNGLN